MLHSKSIYYLSLDDVHCTSHQEMFKVKGIYLRATYVLCYVPVFVQQAISEKYDKTLSFKKRIHKGEDQ